MKINTETTPKKSGFEGERGVSLILTLLVMTMLLGFVALVLSRTTSEVQISYNDAAEARALAASEAGLEDATRDFATVLENKLNPTEKDIDKIGKNEVDGFTDNFVIDKKLKQIGESQITTIQSGDFQGLYSLRDQWQINVDAHETNSDVKVETMRRFYNDRIPLFQFGAFYQDDLELNRPPLFTFSGKVHTNSNLFVSASPKSTGAGVFFKSKVTVAGEIVNDIWKTATRLADKTDDNGDVYFLDGSNKYQQLTTGSGSVKCAPGTGGVLKSNNGNGRPFPYPNCSKNSQWDSFADRFEKNLKANSPELRLPVDRLKIPLIEIMRRGKNVGDQENVGGATVAVTAARQDNETVSKERYANKQGIRISLADAKDKLPGCAGITLPCGVRLDGAGSGSGGDPASGQSRGYQPKDLVNAGGYKTTAVNGNRLYIGGRQVWIKVETVDYDYDKSVPVAVDITEDILSLGMTEQLDAGLTGFVTGYASSQDTRSIVKIQRFYMPGAAIPNSDVYLTNLINGSAKYNFVIPHKINSGSSTLSSGSPCYNFVPADQKVNCETADAFASPLTKNNTTGVGDESKHYKLLCINTASECAKATTEKSLIVPFPIQMYDSREGNRQDSAGAVGSGFLYRNGVMSLIDIDIANLRRFFNGEFDSNLPTTTPFALKNGNVGLKHTNIPENRGWVVYFSDRRGDYDFDGRYNMEDVNPNSNSLVDEDLDDNKIIDTDYGSEAPTQDSTVEAGLASVTDHAYYRRGVRLINAVTLPGKYDTVKPNETKGFTFASENGIYVRGNYNVALNGVTLPGGTAPAESTAYSPQNGATHIPSSVVGDSVTVLSNSWNDADSFVNPFYALKRVASDTQVRFAMIAGDSLTARTASSTSGNFDGLNGGLHNFMRFLESWKSKRLNYSGSLINLYNSFNNNGKWKCCTTVYDPPIRDWTFDSSFNDPNRLPPGSPFVYYISFTGFERVSQ